MLRKYLGPNFLVNAVLDKAKGMYKHEAIAYQGAFLSQARQTLLPYLQRGLQSFPDSETETQLLQQVYEDVNDLYTDEHLIMMQADLLEQMYISTTIADIMIAIHETVRNKTLISKKPPKGSKGSDLVDPDKFPIQRLRYGNFTIYSIALVQIYLKNTKVYLRPIETLSWKDLKEKQAMLYIQKILKSTITSIEAGRGVFLSCKRQGVVLPGTLLGIFPGVICDPNVPLPDTPKRSLRPYLKRFDGFWLDFEKELPYPMPPPGANFQDYFENFEMQREKRGNPDLKLIQVAPELMNPFALGHFINHPPPDTPANVQLVDFDLPYTFFPSVYSKYIPYIKYREEPKRSKTTETRNNDVFRAVAVVAQQTIGHNEELYVDYLMDQRAPIEYTPDWLLEPPPPSPYLEKKEMTAKVPYIVKLMYNHQTSKLGKKFDEFDARTNKELTSGMWDKRVSQIKARLEESAKLEADDDKKLLK